MPARPKNGMTAHAQIAMFATSSEASTEALITMLAQIAAMKFLDMEASKS